MDGSYGGNDEDPLITRSKIYRSPSTNPADLNLVRSKSNFILLAPTVVWPKSTRAPVCRCSFPAEGMPLPAAAFTKMVNIAPDHQQRAQIPR